MKYYPSLAKKLFPLTEKLFFPRWFGFANFLVDISLIIFYSIKSPRFFKGSKLALTLYFIIKQEIDFENNNNFDAKKIHILRKKNAKWLYRRLTDLGAAFIKVGQFIATREDLVSKEYVAELSTLQDSAPKLSIEVIEQVIEKSLGKTAQELFEYIESESIASASIGQVHRARTKDGNEIVLKVQRPNLDKLFLQDLSIARAMSVFFERYIPWGKNKYWPEICDEFGKVLFEEIDFYQEAVNVERMKLNLCEDHPELIIPKVYWDYVTKEVLALEYEPGSKITDCKAIEKAGRNKLWVSQKIISIFFDQFFKHCFFHADPHPGNIAITKNGKIVLYDFGMTYKIDNKIRDNVKEAIISLVSQNTDGLISSLQKMDLIRPGADLALLKNIIQKTTYKYYGGSKLQELDLETIKEDINKVIAASPLRMPPTLAYVFRTIGIIEGLCRTFDPNFNFIEALKPYTKEWLIQSKSVGILEKLLTKAIDKTGFQGAEGLLEIARIPIKANKLLSQMESGDFSIPIDLKPLQNKIERIEEITQGIAFMLIGIILLCAGAICWQFLNALGLLFTVLSVSIAFTGVIFFLLGIKKIVFH